jgi:hypothetical protein
MSWSRTDKIKVWLVGPLASLSPPMDVEKNIKFQKDPRVTSSASSLA